MEESARLKLKEIKNDGSDKVSAYREAINDHASKLDVAGTFYHGKESELPATGLIDRYFHADDSGILWRDNGTAWEPINRNYNEDTLQAGVIASTDWSFTANINSGTGALGSTGATGGGAWLPNSTISGALVRSATASAALSGIAPSKLPTSGKYISCAFELTPSTWGAAATITAHSGTEKSTEAEAIAAPPATTAGKMQVRRVIIKNTSGVYSIVAEENVRPWATGGNVATETAAEGKIGTEAASESKIKALAVTTGKLAARAVTAAKIALEVIGDEHIVKGRALIAPEGGSTEPLKLRIAGNEYEPSATRLTIVVARVAMNESHAFVGGTEVAEGPEANATLVFICGPKQKWKITGKGAGETIHSTYYIL